MVVVGACIGHTSALEVLAELEVVSGALDGPCGSDRPVGFDGSAAFPLGGPGVLLGVRGCWSVVSIGKVGT